MARTHATDADKAFGERLRALLKEARKDANKSVQSAADAAEVTIHGLYAFERGQVLTPGLRTVYLLSNAYGVDLTTLARRAEGVRS